jgi:hypothetical protein
MTEVLVVRMNREEMSRLKLAAKKKSQTRSAYARALLRRGLEKEEVANGAGWPERLRELREKGVKRPWLKGHPEDELREQDNNRWR